MDQPSFFFGRGGGSNVQASYICVFIKYQFFHALCSNNQSNRMKDASCLIPLHSFFELTPFFPLHHPSFKDCAGPKTTPWSLAIFSGLYNPGVTQVLRQMPTFLLTPPIVDHVFALSMIKQDLNGIFLFYTFNPKIHHSV